MLRCTASKLMGGIEAAVQGDGTSTTARSKGTQIDPLVPQHLQEVLGQERPGNRACAHERPVLECLLFLRQSQS